MSDSRISMGISYPIVWFNYTRGIDGFLDGEYTYNKVDLKIKETFVLKYLGRSNFDLRACFVDRPIPNTNRYNGRGSNLKFITYAPNSFCAMRVNEFLSDRYIYLFYTHEFGKLLWRGKGFSPESALVANMGFCWLKHPEYNKNIFLLPWTRAILNRESKSITCSILWVSTQLGLLFITGMETIFYLISETIFRIKDHF